ncbi:hypothetical protein DRP05_10540 [Archaeoglobales archaeon]|nr:MAG: hypothetical protein DRP05_10540 [Archaeoglobales archaeon]
MRVSRKLRRQGSSYVITIPVDIVGLLGWEAGDSIFFKLEGGKLILEKGGEI